MFVSLCCAAHFHSSSPFYFDMAGSWNFQPCNPRHQKFIEPGEKRKTCEAARRSAGAPTLPSLSLSLLLSFSVFFHLSPRSISLSLSFFVARSSSLTTSPSLSHFAFHLLLPPPSFFTILSSLYHPTSPPFVIVAIFSHRGRHATAILSRSLFLSCSPSFSCRCLTLSTSR